MIRSIRQDGLGDDISLTAFHAAYTPGVDQGRIDDSNVYTETVAVTKNDFDVFVAPGETPSIIGVTHAFTLAVGVTGFKLAGESESNVLIAEGGAATRRTVDALGTNGAITLEHVKSTEGAAMVYLNGAQAGPLTMTDCEVDGCDYMFYGVNAQNLALSYVRVGPGSVALGRTNNLGGLIEHYKGKGQYIMAPIAAAMGYTGSPILRNFNFENTGGGMTPALKTWSESFKVREGHLKRADGIHYGLWYEAGVCAVPPYENCSVEGFMYGISSTYGGAPAVTSNCCAFGAATANWWAPAVKQGSDIEVDPLVIDDDTGEITAASPCFNAGMNTGTTDDIRGEPRPIATLYDIGPWEVSAPYVTGAAFVDRYSCTVTFSENMIGADLTDPTKWALTPMFGADAVTIDSVAYNAGTFTATLSLSGSTPFGSGQLYRATAPGTITSALGMTISATGRDADFITGKYAEEESGNPWAAAIDGTQVDIGAAPFEMVTWDAGLPAASLEQAVWISLFSDRRARNDDPLPDESGDPPRKKGWWADSYQRDGDRFGSRLWLHYRSPVNAETIAGIKEAAEESLDWLVTDSIAGRVEATAERYGENGIALGVVIYRADGTEIRRVRFDSLWDAWDAARLNDA